MKKQVDPLWDAGLGPWVLFRPGLCMYTLWRGTLQGLMWAEEFFFYQRCHERGYSCTPWQLKPVVGTEGWRAAIKASSSLLHVEFPRSWLKYQHIAAIFPPTRAPSFNNLQNEGGRWEAIKVTYICLISEALSFTNFALKRKKKLFIVHIRENSV